MIVIADTGALISLSIIDKLDLLDKLYDEVYIPKKDARLVAETNDVTCAGTLAVLIKARAEGMLESLSPLFKKLKEHERYFSNSLLNKILTENGEMEL